MLQYEKIDASEGIDVNKTSASKQCEFCHYWFFKDVGFNFEEHVCNGCYDLLMMGYSLENIAILTAKGATFTCILWGISRNEGLRRLKNFAFEDKGVLKIGFRANKTHIQVIREGVFGGTYSRDIYSAINGKWYKKSRKVFDQLKNIDQKYYSSDYYDISVNKYGVECGTSLRFWENKGWINEIDPYGWFQPYFKYWLGRRSKDDERQINRCKKNRE